ncbi:hypothetical protein GX586_04455 [bacterium]|nr:hypothetical protein [bacterium]
MSINMHCIAAVFLSVALLCPAASNAALITQYWGGGEVDIADNTDVPIGSGPALGGIWNATIKNWANATNVPNTYSAWQNGSDRVAWFAMRLPNIAQSAYVTVATDMVVHQIRDEVTAAGNFNQYFFFVADEPRTIRLEPAADGTQPKLGGTTQLTRGARYTSNIRLAGTNGFMFIGGNNQVWNVCEDLTGTVVFNGAGSTYFTLGNNGAMPNVGTFHLLGIEAFTYGPNSAGLLDRLGDSCVIRGSTRTGKFEYNGQRHATTPSTETIGKLLLDGHMSLDLDTYSGSGALFPVLHLAEGIDRGPTGKGTLGSQVNAAAPQVRALIIVSNPPYATDTLIPWLANERGGFCQIKSSDLSIDTVAMTPAPDDLATWVAGSDYTLPYSFNPVNELPTIAINSLGIFCSNKTLTVASDATLTINSGGISYNYQGPTGSRTITGGAITSGTNELYIVVGTSGAAADLDISSTIAGDIDVIIGGNFQVKYLAPAGNTYTGTTYVHGRLIMAAPSGVAVPGDLVLSGSAYVQHSLANQIATTANVTIRENARLYHSNFAQSYSGIITLLGGTLEFAYQSVSFNGSGYGIVFNGGTLIDTNAGGGNPHDLNTDVRYESTATSQALMDGVAGTRIRLMGSRVFNIDDSASLPDGTSEMLVNINLGENGAASLTKQGDGVLELTANGFYSGDTTVDAGTLLVQAALTGATVTVNAGGTLGGSGTASGTVAVNGTIDPGGSIGVFNAGNLAMNAGCTYLWEVDPVDNNTADVVNVAGTLTLPAEPNSVTVKVVRVGSLGTTGAKPVFTFSSLSGSAGSLFVDLSGSGLTNSYVGVTANSIEISLIPEPAVLGIACVALAALRRTRVVK